MIRVAILSGVSLGVSLGLAALAMGCSSNTTSPGYQEAGAASCQPASMAATDASCALLDAGSMCAMGNTCCLSGPLPVTGNCVQSGTCNSNFQFECHNKGECSCGQCCATFIVPDAGAGPFTPQQDLQLLMMSTVKSSCQASCPSGQTQLCTGDSDCPSGMHCQEFFQPGDAGVSVGTVLMNFQGCF